MELSQLLLHLWWWGVYLWQIRGIWMHAHKSQKVILRCGQNPGCPNKSLLPMGVVRDGSEPVNHWLWPQEVQRVRGSLFLAWEWQSQERRRVSWKAAFPKGIRVVVVFAFPSPLSSIVSFSSNPSRNGELASNALLVFVVRGSVLARERLV